MRSNIKIIADSDLSTVAQAKDSLEKNWKIEEEKDTICDFIYNS